MKNIGSAVNNTLGGMTRRLNITEKDISECEYVVIETI
jgi:hypothetical protein